ncbi:MAG: hypothetical protein NG740_05895 [Omnitrophica bacterium]|nr:hypothetical protein [Candidatus Omnitrophota bacterium]
MKIIKDKRLFGVFNALDIFIIIFILAVIIPMLHYYIKFNEKGFAEEKTLERYLGQQGRTSSTLQDKQSASVIVDISFKNLTEKDLEKIKVGDKETLPNGSGVAEILWLGKPEKNYVVVKNLFLSASDFQDLILEDKLYALPAKLKLNGFVLKGNFYYKAHITNPLDGHAFIAPDYSVDFIIEMYPYGKTKRFSETYKN